MTPEIHHALTRPHTLEPEELDELSPFELKEILLALAQGDEPCLDAGRGNPNWVATAPREAFFALGHFALAESRRVWSEPGLGGMPEMAGIAGRFAAWCDTHRDEPGLDVLHAVVGLGAEFGFEPDAWVYELTDGIIGDRYPIPDRMATHGEAVVRQFLVDELCAGVEPPSTLRLFAVEGGSAAMCYLFDSLHTNRLLLRGDKVALMVPAFTPYLEIPRLDRYGFEIVEVRADAVDEHGARTWQFPDAEANAITANAAGNGPDILTLPNDFLGGALQNGTVKPLTLGASELAAYEKSAVASVSRNGQVWALPYGMENLVLYRNTKAAPKAPATVEELVSTGQSAVKKGTVKRALSLPVGQEGDAYHMHPFFTSAGGSLFAMDSSGQYDTTEVGIGTPESVAAAKKIAALGEKGSKVLSRSVDGSNAIAQFTAGNAAYLVSGPWALADIRKSGIPYDITPIPPFQGGKPAAPFLGVQAFWMLSNAKNPAFAEEFVTKTMNTPEAMTAMYEQDPRPPVRSDVLTAVSAKDAGHGQTRGRRQERDAAARLPVHGGRVAAAGPGLRRDRGRGRPGDHYAEDRKGHRERGPGEVIRILCLGIAVGTAAALTPSLIGGRHYVVLTVAWVVVAVLLATYATRRALLAKYLVPGTLLLVVFTVAPVLATLQLSTTNYGDGTRTSKEQTITRIVGNSVVQAPDSPKLNLSVATTGDGDYTFLLVDRGSGTAYAGNEDGLAELSPDAVTVTNGFVSAADGYTILTARQVNDAAAQLREFAVPTDGGAIRQRGLREAFEGRTVLRYDKVSDTITDTDTGARYTVQRQDDRQYFVDASGTRLSDQSWRAGVGLENYRRAFTDERILSGFLRIFGWTVVFAAGSVVLTFAVGLGLAVMLNDPRVRGQKWYRSVLLLPYAIPGFISILVWSGFFNQEFGLINNLTGLRIDWLGDPIRGQGGAAAAQPVARLPLHVPGRHRRPAGHPGRAEGGGPDRRRGRVHRLPPDHVPVAAGGRGAHSGGVVRLQLQQLQRDRAAHPRWAVHAGQPRRGRDRHPHQLHRAARLRRGRRAVRVRLGHRHPAVRHHRRAGGGAVPGHPQSRGGVLTCESVGGGRSAGGTRAGWWPSSSPWCRCSTSSPRPSTRWARWCRPTSSRPSSASCISGHCSPIRPGRSRAGCSTPSWSAWR